MHTIVLLLLAVVADLAAVWALRRLRPVWSGRRIQRLPRSSATSGLEINHRNYVAFTLFVTGLGGWMTVLALGWLATGDLVTGMRSLLLAPLFHLLLVVSLVGLVCMPLITAFARPRSLVPPGHRDHPGAVPAWWRRRRGG